MSLILDALRKLDRERSSRRNEPANIAVEILRPELPRRERRIQLYLAAIFLTAVFTAAITYAVIRGVGSWSKSSPPSPVISPAPSLQASPPGSEVDAPPKSSSPAPAISVSPGREVAPTPPEVTSLPKTSPPVSISPPSPLQQVTPTPPDIDSGSKSSPPSPVISPAPSLQASPSSPPSEPARGARDEIGRMPPKPQAPAKSRGSTLLPDEQKESQNVITKETQIAPTKTRETAGPPLNRSETALPSLKITAIGWYEEPSKRFAFVNGIMTYEGGFIEGVKIVEIFTKHVRFFHKGRYFEIPIH